MSLNGWEGKKESQFTVRIGNKVREGGRGQWQGSKEEGRGRRRRKRSMVRWGKVLKFGLAHGHVALVFVEALSLNLHTLAPLYLILVLSFVTCFEIFLRGC